MKNELAKKDDTETTFRRLEILFLLWSGGRYTSSDFTDRYGVTKPTIAHDIALLAKRYDIRGVSGPNGGYYYAGEPIYFMRERTYSAIRDFLASDSGLDVKTPEELPLFDKIVASWNEENKRAN